MTSRQRGGISKNIANADASQASSASKKRNVGLVISPLELVAFCGEEHAVYYSISLLSKPLLPVSILLFTMGCYSYT
jgi:hypothetical protein